MKDANDEVTVDLFEEDIPDETFDYPTDDGSTCCDDLNDIMSVLNNCDARGC